MSKPTVLLVTGSGRSGSTILGNVLGEVQDWFHIGEMSLFWQLGSMENRACGCGKAFHACDFWQNVVGSVLSANNRITAEKMAYLESTLPTHKSLLSTLITGRKATIDGELLSVTERLYHSIADLSRARVIVDTSKFPSYAYLLTQIPSVDVRMIHLIRDARAVAYSWQRKKVRDDVYEENYTWKMDKRNVVATAARWQLKNFLAEWLGRSLPYARLRYEDFAQRPSRSLPRLLRLAGEEKERRPVLHDNTVYLGTNHTVWGNPSRMLRGPTILKLDDEWRRKMTVTDFLSVTSVTWLLLRRYGYQLARNPGDELRQRRSVMHGPVG